MNNPYIDDNLGKNDSDKTESQREGPHIELNAFIKSLGLASSGGQAKHFIRDGNVKINGTVETRNKKKLYSGDVVEIEGKKYKVEI